MKDRRMGHRHGRNSGGFEAHRADRGGDDVRRGRAWRFIPGGGVESRQPHYRVTARIAALPGKHIRSVREPAKPAHGKVL